MQLSALQQQILTILCWRCRCATLSQLSAAVGSDQQSVESAVRGMASQRLLGSQSLPLQQIKLCEPLAAWRVGVDEPELGRVAWQLEARWIQAPRQVARVVWATPLAGRLVGGVGGSLRQLAQLQHDIGVTEAFVRTLAVRPPACWIGEDAYRAMWNQPRSAKVPDAVIVNECGDVISVVEFGGQYTRQRLESFHRYWAIGQRIPYVIW